MHTTASPRRTRIASLGLAALAAIGLTLGVASPALAHDELVDRSIVATDDGRVDAIRLSFSNSIIEVGTEIVVTSADGADMTDGAPQIAGPDVVQPLTADLPEGDYDVAWRVVSSDGHPIDGSFVLRLSKPDAWQAEGAALVEPDQRLTEGSEQKATEGTDAAHEGEGHDSADHGTDTTSEEGGLSTGAIAAISIGAVLVAGGALAAVLIGQRRRAAGMNADAANKEDRA